MGDYNWNSPTVRGMETRLARSRDITLSSPLVAVALRVKTGAVTVNRFHHFLRLVEGTPGLAIELVTDLDPPVTTTMFAPGTDTGAITTGWEDTANLAVNFGDVDNRFAPDNATAHARNSTPLGSVAPRLLLFSGDAALALAGQRILKVGLHGSARMFNRPTSTNVIKLEGVLRINATDYILGEYSFGKGDQFVNVPVGSAAFNPATGLPWTLAEVDDLIDAADADLFGLRVTVALAAAENVNVGWFGLEVTHCVENRRARYYDSGQPRAGWNEVTPTDAAVSPANTYEWLVISCPRAGGASKAILSLVQAPEVVEALAATATTGEHREAAILDLTHPGGVARTITELPGELLAVLLEATAEGTPILAQSQPYAAVAEVPRRVGATANVGQQVTTAAAQTYAAVRLPVGWADKARRPDRPLKVEVRDGGGAISGGGTLRAEGFLDPQAVPDGTMREVQIRIDTPGSSPGASPFLFAATTQYHILISSEAAASRGWALSRADTRSDSLGGTGAPTLAEVEAQSQGGQTDSYVEAGAALDRYDLPLSLIAPPAAPTGFSAVALPEEVDELDFPRLPPRIKVTWNATALGAAFGGWRLWRRPRRVPVAEWTLRAERIPTSVETPATVETLERAFIDETAGLAVPGSRYEHGWDYAVTVLSATTGLESDRGDAMVQGVTVTGGCSSWLTSSTARWLSTPLHVDPGTDATPFDRTEVFPHLAGRDGAAARATGGVPGSTWRLRPRQLRQADDDILRVQRAGAVEGREMAFLGDRGDLAHGVAPYAAAAGVGLVLAAEFDFVGTSRHPEVASYNLHAGLVLNGTTQRVTTGDHGDLDPASGPWTFFLYAAPPAAIASRTFLAKRTTGDGYQLGYSAASVLSAILDGASATATLTDPTWVADGEAHLWIVSTNGATQQFYRDGVLVDSDAVVHGAIGNSELLVAGALSNATQHTALAPLHSWGCYRRVLTEAERLALRRYLLGWFGYRAPAGAVPFHDIRDERASIGAGTTLHDLSGEGHSGTIVAAPSRRGTPWPLGDLEAANLSP